jgi:thiopeptide-type bacteriocin biosynthesis protein
MPGGQVIEPAMFNAVEPVNFAHPLARFLAEAPHALSAPCAPFDWGTAGTLPFLPALRYGKTLLSAAVWRMDAATLPGKRAGWDEWDGAFAAWRETVNMPGVVSAGTGDQRITLDLAVAAHRALLRDELGRAGTVTLRAAPGAQDTGWAGGHVHEVTVPLGMTARPAPAPPWLATAAAAARDEVHLPYRDGRLYVKVYAAVAVQDQILTRHLPRLAAGLGEAGAQWWFLRYHDPAPHLRLRVRAGDGMLAGAARLVAGWCEQVRRAGLAARVQWDTYYPETARFGGPAAMRAVEAYFAADSSAVLAQLSACASRGGPDAAALTAASMLDIACGLAGGPGNGTGWLIGRRQGPVPAPPRAAYDEAVTLADPGRPGAIAALSGGSEILSAWARRRDALAAWRRAVEEMAAMSPLSLLPDLLHLHHVRMTGADRERERACIHLARAAALSWTARKKETR